MDELAPYSSLTFHRRRNGVPIVPAEEYHGSFERRREVASRVEIHRRSGAVAEVNDRYRRLLLGIRERVELELVGRADGLGYLRAQGTADRLVIQGPRAVVDRHLPPLAEVEVVREALVAELLEGEAAPHQQALRMR